MTRLLPGAVLAGFVAAPVPAEDPSRGETLYYDYGCYACHGYNGTGRTPLDPATSGVLADETVFLRYLRLRADENPVNPKNSMPNYSADTLSDADARHIHAYLASLEHDPPAIDDIPVFKELLEHAENDPPLEPDR